MTYELKTGNFKTGELFTCQVLSLIDYNLPYCGYVHSGQHANGFLLYRRALTSEDFSWSRNS